MKNLLLESLRNHARQQPQKVALSALEQNLTWQDLASAVDELTGHFVVCNRLGLLMKNSPAWVIADLAALDAELCNIPLPTFFSDEQLIHALTDASIDHVLTDQAERIMDLVDVIEAESLEIAGIPCQLLKVRSTIHISDTDSVCKVTYTSGTTGSPKGVQLMRAQIETVAQSLAEAARGRPDDRALVLLPLSTLLENIGSVYVPLLKGAQILVPSPEALGIFGSSHIVPETLAKTLNLCHPTTLIVPPQLLKLLVMLARQQLLPGSIRFIAVGGAPVGQALLDQAEALGLPVFQGYGLSEACSVVAVNTPAANRKGSVGRPLPHQQVRITDKGEICILGQTFSGYLNEPKRNINTELMTGDLGYLDDDGYLYVTGRINNRIITSYGRNVSPEWLESELQSHPAITQAAVLGSDKPYLIAVLVPSRHRPVHEQITVLEKAIGSVNQALPDYAQIQEFLIAEEPFTLKNGLCTANGRPRHDLIESRYFTEITKLYAEGKRTLF